MAAKEGFKSEWYEVELMFTEAVLGAIPLDPEMYKKHGPGKEADLVDLEEELETIPSEDVIEDDPKGLTGFHRDEKGTILEYDYVIRGYFKAVCGFLRRVPGTRSNKLLAYKKVIDGLVFVKPRQIPMVLPEGVDSNNLEILSRPLRASTAQGDRVALAHSEIVPAGTTMKFKVECVGGFIKEELLREWLSHGENYGLRQWRNGGYGTFTYTMMKII